MNLSDDTKLALNKVLASSAGVLAEAIDSSGKIVKDNVKELVNEVVLFKGIIENAISFTYAVICIAVCVHCWSFLSNLNAELLEDINPYLCKGMLSVVMFFLGAWTINSIVGILKAKLAPRLFLIEFAKDLVSTGSSK